MSALLAADPDALVARLVNRGDHVHLAATPSRPNALIYALCRVLGRDGRLTVSTTAVHSSAHALALSGVAAKVIACFFGDVYPTPRPNPLYRDLARGRPFAAEPWSLLSYTQRLIAGAQGVPYAVTSSLLGTDLAEGKGADLVALAHPAEPGGRLALLSALRPDVALVHGVCADEDGNIALAAPFGEGGWAAYAARRGVIATVERMVSRERMRSFSDRVVIPGQRTLGVCEARLGAHPQALRTGGVAAVRGYLDDYDFIEQIVDACAGPDGGRGWYRQWVTAAGSHQGYLDQLGQARIARLVAEAEDLPGAAGAPDIDAHFDELEEVLSAEARSVEALKHAVRRTVRRAVPEAVPPSGPLAALPPRAEADRADADRSTDAERAITEPESPAPSRQEQLIVLAARAICDLVAADGYDTLLAGIGSSHMAAWLAAGLLQRAGTEVKIVAELGMYGFVPQDGDMFLFSLRHARSAQQLSGITEILGGMVAANPRALGVLAAAEIDPTGAVNTSMGRDGGWLTGSGGANDIASTADCLVVAPASPRRYVERVAYRTSPGTRVRTVVSQYGRMHRDGRDGGFRVATWLSPQPEGDAGPRALAAEAETIMASATCWAPRAADVVAEKPVTAEEIRLLRSLDPDGRYR
ncbi:hypothetical protein KGA66_15095 [Actinocrinis puniceicyclus]|uniref:Uncharacterized protein n=1 Tax=Actinocrinis puniceicyclus TaxID=977794 RepID=A0A8J7WQZ2_9ACTN|nr:CoA-transferase [Actinocrinis puniceicyclus]MBS2964382.1 hypothetical protein [Actinocrinis puniceicyclus]